jgi:hypothetical protein
VNEVRPAFGGPRFAVIGGSSGPGAQNLAA